MTFTFKMRGETFAAPTLQELSSKYCAARDASGEGNSTFPKPTVYRDRKAFGTFSYNGRIWNGGEIIYDNRLEA
jgi:hypothetical protein